ncbi:MAG TPA: carbohydrate porin [Methylocella sp.]|nr:carbohydrate porin [Methylocella sp.]
MKNGLRMLSIVASLTAPAFAADLAPSPPLLASNPWEGFYAGGHVGYFFSGISSYISGLPSVPAIGQTSVVAEEHQFGPLNAGYQAGYNYVFASGLLLGGEADITFADFAKSNLQQSTAALGPSVVNDSIQMYGSIRGRIGFAADDWLFYGIGGFAYDRDRLNTTDFATGSLDDNVYFWRPGWTAGAGVEVLLTANLSAKLEYDFYDFARVNIFLPVAGEPYNSNLKFQTVWAGLNYHFNDNPVAPGTTGGILPQSVRDDMSVHAQSTFILDSNAPFPAAYTGTNSLGPIWQTVETWSVTGFFGYKDPLEGTEFYFNPEPFQGYGLAQTHGLASFPDIEAQKAGYNFPHYYTARLFLRHVFGLGGDTEDIADGPNQVAAKEDISRLTFTLGKIGVPDIFDNNTYSHDGRSSFLNWALVDCGAFNYSADQQGYVWGTVLDLNQKEWALRAGYFLVPDVSNGENWDTRIGRRGQYILEAQHNFSLLGMDGIVRVLGFENQFYAGSFAATLANPYLSNPLYDGGTVNIVATRETRSQYGFVGNVELAATKDLGLFARIGWWNGQSEIIYTDIDGSASFGAVLKGTAWGRPNDRVGLAGAISEITPSYQAYLAAGGLGVNIGDGALSYRPEEIIETYYSVALADWSYLTFDYQFAANPGYNYVRGPVSIGSVRLHLQF